MRHWFRRPGKSPARTCERGPKQSYGAPGLRNVVREINRSYYYANVYEFPIAFARIGDREVIIYCPDEYNRLEIEDVNSGERLGYSGRTGSSASLTPAVDSGSSNARDPSDVFHSRLSISPGGDWLMSNGWYWHPHDALELFPLNKCAGDAKLLDNCQWKLPGTPMTQSASFLNDDMIVAGLGEGWYDKTGEEIRGQTSKTPLNTLAVWHVGDATFQHVVHLERQMGTLLPVSETEVFELFDYPKILDIQSGQTLRSWPEISTGHQASCIIRDQHPPPMAYHRDNRRLAVGHGDAIHVISPGE